VNSNSVDSNINYSNIRDGRKFDLDKLVSNSNRSTSYSEGIQSKIDSKSLDDRKTKIETEAKQMRETASKRSKTILVVGLVAGAIAGIVGGALALAGIVAGTAAMIPFIIAGVSVFAGIIFALAFAPETEQMYGARLTVEYAKKALTSDDKEKAEALSYINNILATTENIGDKEFYLYEERSNLLHLAVKAILVENKEEIISCLNNNDSGVKSGAINLLTKAIGRKDLFNEAKEILADIFIKSESKDTAKKLFADGILNQGTVEKMIHDESTKDEMLDLLWLMSKDKDLKNVVVNLVGSDIADKLTNLNPQSTTEEKNKIIEEIKGLSLGIPTKLNAGDIVYKDSHDFRKKLTILQQSEKNIQKANELKKIFKEQGTVKELKDRFSKNDGLHHEDGKIQGCFLQYKDRDFNKETNKIDSKKVAEQSIMDLNRDLFSIKRNGSKYIIKNQDKVEEGLKKLLEKKPIEDDEFAKIIKDKMEVDINTLCSFPGQSVQGNVSILLSKSGLFAENTLSTYSVSINDDGTIDLTVHDVLKVEYQSGFGRSTLPVAIEEKMVFRLNKQNEGEYVPITPIEAQVNVYDADVLVEDNENAEYKEPLALRIREKITSTDWKNDKVEIIK
jgi:hypothetical protein